MYFIPYLELILIRNNQCGNARVIGFDKVSTPIKLLDALPVCNVISFQTVASEESIRWNLHTSFLSLTISTLLSFFLTICRNVDAILSKFPAILENRSCSFLFLFFALSSEKRSWILNVQHHFSIGTDVKCALGFGEGHRRALWHDSALEGVLGGGCGGPTWDSWEFAFAFPFTSGRDIVFSAGGSPRWFLFVGFRVTSCCGAAGGALSTDWRLAARCRESRSGFFGGAGRVFASWELYTADISEFSDARDWVS